MLTTLLICICAVLTVVVVLQHFKIIGHKCANSVALDVRLEECRETMIASIEEATALADRVASQIADPPVCKECAKGFVCRLIERVTRR